MSRPLPAGRLLVCGAVLMNLDVRLNRSEQNLLRRAIVASARVAPGVPPQTATDKPLDGPRGIWLTAKEMHRVHRSALHGSTRGLCAKVRHAQDTVIRIGS